MNEIDQFTNQYDYLSNFYYCSIKHNNAIYPSSEHLFQALKTNDVNEQEIIRKTNTPAQAKKAGRKVKLREDWENVKKSVMKYVIELKFDQNSSLRYQLLTTYPAILIEGNYWHDNYWGDCYCNKCKSIEGKNHLGHILMKYRDDL